MNHSPRPSARSPPPSQFTSLKVNKLALQTQVSNLRPFLNTKQERLVRRLFNYLHGKSSAWIKVANFAEKLFRLNLASFKFEISFYFDLIKEVSRERLLLKLMKAHYRSKAKQQKVARKEKILPSQKIVHDAIKKLYQNNKKSHAILLILMFLTGRRSIDLLRLKSSDVKKLDSNLYAAAIDQDKKHAYKLHFKIDLSFWDIKWCGLKKSTFIHEFSELQKEPLVFGKVCKASLAREVGDFQPHILRSIRALILLKMGFQLRGC